ncbi:MAG: hypothetical protein ACRDA3_13210 [Peptostreptococcaceae bacterium]
MKVGLMRALKIVQREILVAQEINSIMALGMVRIEALIKKELIEIDEEGRCSDYFTSVKSPNGTIILTILNTDSKFKDLPLFGCCIVINFGIELLPTIKLNEYIDIHHPNMTVEDRGVFLTDIAATIWEEYGMLVLSENKKDEIVNFK